MEFLKPTVQLDAAKTPDGGEMKLFQHDRDFLITVNGHELMNSRQHESELELARLGCAACLCLAAPKVLIGGLGLGYTLRETLDLLGDHASIIVSELMDVVVQWNREHLGILNDFPLQDKRVTLKMGSVVNLIGRSENRFDSILLDVDNGPTAFTDPANQDLYGPEGIKACMRALRESGCLAVWSSDSYKPFEQSLVRCGLHVRRYRASAYKGSKSQNRFVWVASLDKHSLPSGGGQPRLTTSNSGEKRGFGKNRRFKGREKSTR